MVQEGQREVTTETSHPVGFVQEKKTGDDEETLKVGGDTILSLNLALSLENNKNVGLFFKIVFLGRRMKKIYSLDGIMAMDKFP